MIKVIGKRKILTIEQRLQAIEKLNSEMDRLRPYKKPKGLILRFKSYDDQLKFILTRAAKKI